MPETDGKQNGAGAGNGAAAAAGGEPPLLVGDLSAVQASLGANGSASNGARYGPGSGVLSTMSIDAAEGVEGFLPPEQAGQLEAAAQEALAERERRSQAEASTSAPAQLSAEGTPYVAPGGRWSQFKTYSTFQRTWDIWRFGLAFFFKLWCINQVGGKGGRERAREGAAVRKGQ